MTGHQAKVPDIAAAYFASHPLVQPNMAHPVIAQTYRPGIGWKRHNFTKRVSLSYCRGLKREGVMAVALTVPGTDIRADFAIAELVTR